MTVGIRKRLKTRNTWRQYGKLDAIERGVTFISCRDSEHITYGLESVRWRIDARFDVCRKNGKAYEKPEAWDSVCYFNHSREAVDCGLIEALGICVKKRMSRDGDVTIRCINIISSLLRGCSWIDDGEVCEEKAVNLLVLVISKVVGCDLVSTLLLVIEKLYNKCGKVNRELVIESMAVLSLMVSLSQKYKTSSVILDPRKEFVIVDAVEHQLTIQQRGLEAFPIITDGCVILEAYVCAHPLLRRNRTCKLIRTLLVDVYSLFYPEPYYFIWAIAVLDVLMKTEINCVHFENEAFFILKFLKNHNTNSQRIVYKELETLLYKSYVNKN